MPTNLLEDVSTLQLHQFILQAQQFMKGQAEPLTYYEAVAANLPCVIGTQHEMAMDLLHQIEMNLVNGVSSQLKQALEQRHAGQTKAAKPADIYRKYAKALRKVSARDGEASLFASELLAELYLEQTQPDGYLETPDYIDPYTGSPIYEDLDVFARALPDQHVAGIEELFRFVNMAPDTESDGFDGVAPFVPGNSWEKELRGQAEHCRVALGWGDREVEAFLNANRVGVSMREEPEQFGEDREYVPPTLVKDFNVDNVVVAEAWPAIKAFNTKRSEIFDWMGKRVPRWKDGKVVFTTRVTGQWHDDLP